MGVNASTLPARTVDKMFTGLRAQGQVSAVERMAGIHKIKPKSLQGILPQLTTASMLPRDAERIPQGAKAKPNSISFAQPSYNCERCPGITSVPDGVMADIDQYNLEGLNPFLEVALSQANHVANSYFKTVLSSTSLNTERAAAAQWNDPANAEPFTDLEAVIRLIGKFDTMILGDNVIHALAQTEAFKAQNINYAGSNGMIPQGAVETALKALYPHLKNVYVFDDMYNAAAEGQDVSLGFVFDGIAWVGYAKNLVFVEQEDPKHPRSEQQRDAESRSTLFSYELNLDIVRVDPLCGAIITGVIA